MTPGSWPTDPASAARMLAILLLDIDKRTFEEREYLLANFLSIAWPTHIGQKQ
jgi:hypothetical protein